MTSILAKHIVTAQRWVMAKRDNVEKREADPRWPKSDVDIQRALLADSEDLLAFLQRLERHAPAIRKAIQEAAS